MFVGGRVPGAMPLAMLYMAVGQKSLGKGLALLGPRCIWPLAMGLFAKGDGYHSQGQSPWGEYPPIVRIRQRR